ncbi:MAG: hypothetical protein DWQ47_02780 [Acidobacteria bacterium]|nr:MAG: hypothetical protein DWQ32_06330 [Acidobacteriota bacterium]REK01334.1 MAG: hypothetical protein DWQ38_02765 [Acidobacteriota bacterium]REK14290.1 MAG: hypothetical protein DWQ43_12020 [Acidobacteriota bacterium]REK45005.1 MAG: hypothetical protein DWQ47_02780 [Acidobacteriota bacterium]
MSGTGESKYSWTYGVRFIPDAIDRAKWRNTLTYQVTSRLSLGIEYNPLAGRVSPLANYVLVTENASRPAIILGTSSDRIGTPSGQSFYATVSKDLERETGLPIAPYAGVTFGTFENKFRPIGGLSVRLPLGFSSTVLFDGVKVHPLAGYGRGRHQLGFILVEGKRPGFNYNVSF